MPTLILAMTQPASTPTSGALPSASLPSPADPALPPLRAVALGEHQRPEADGKPPAKRDPFVQADATGNDGTAQTSAIKTQAAKTAESWKAELSPPAAPDSSAPATNHPDAGAVDALAAPVGQQSAASPASGTGLSPKQTPDQVVQSASVNLPVMPASSLSKTAFEQVTEKNSGQNLTSGKSQRPAGASSAARRASKEDAGGTSGTAESKPDAPSGDAVKAIDQSGAADTHSGKAHADPSGASALPPSVPRAEGLPQTDAGDAAPQSDASSQAPADNRAATPAALPGQQSSDLFHSAQLVEKVAQSELNLGIRTGEFGNVEIRTSFDHQQVKAEIFSERGDLGRTLSAELPGLEQRMREQDVSLSAVVIRNASGGAGGTLDRDPRRQQQPLPTPGPAMEASSSEPTTIAPQPAVWEPEGILDVCI